MTKSIIILFSLMPFFMSGQKQISETISTNAVSKFDLSMEYANVKITGWDRNEIAVTGTVSIGTGEYDDNYSLTLENKGGTIYLVSTVKNEDDIPYVVKAYNESGEVVFRSTVKDTKKKWNFDDTLEKGSYAYINYSRDIEVDLEIKVPNSLPIKATSNFGDATIENFQAGIEYISKHGFIEVVYGPNVKFSNSILESQHDFVDVSLPTNSKVSVRLQSNFGEIMTDHDLKIDPSKSSSESFKEVVFADVNGGGPVIQMMAKHDNVYLRKGK